MGINPYTILFIVLAIVSNLILSSVFKQGILAIVGAIIFLICAAYSTKTKKSNITKLF